ncbi:MAG: hypothetical protein RL660_728 [Bacteroidota bacterium]|jgi:hypothetical protein
MKFVLLALCVLACNACFAQQVYTVGIIPTSLANPDNRVAVELGRVDKTKGIAVFSSLGYIVRSDAFTKFVHPVYGRDNFLNGKQGGFLGDVLVSAQFRPEYFAGLFFQYKYASASFDDALANPPYLAENNRLHKQRLAFAAVVTNHSTFLNEKVYCNFSVGLGGSYKQNWRNGVKVSNYITPEDGDYLRTETNSGSMIFALARLSCGIQIGARKKTSSFKEK